jgi:cyclophilin family peptidyl-prolyl cis-trans isomerase
MPRTVLALVLAMLLALVGAACGDDRQENAGGQPASEGDATPTPEAESSGCEQVEAPAPKGAQQLPRPKLELEEGTTYVATVITSCGEFDITLDPERAPKTGGSFVSLARKGFYDGTIFHRVVPGFVIQGGDPMGSGQGGPGYSVVEAPPSSLGYTKGVVAMAKTAVEDPGTSGSQFFVVTGEDAGLPPEYALLGEVTRGIEVVDRIGVIPVGPDERPTQPVVIRQVKVEER